MLRTAEKHRPSSLSSVSLLVVLFSLSANRKKCTSPNSRKERWAELEVLAGFDANKVERKPRAAAMTHVTAVTVAVTVTDSWFLIHDDLMTHDS